MYWHCCYNLCVHEEFQKLRRNVNFTCEFEEKRYWIPKKKDDFRVGMIVEYFSNNTWNEKLVENPNDEWDRMYKLMLKYDKIRIQSVN